MSSINWIIAPSISGLDCPPRYLVVVARAERLGTRLSCLSWAVVLHAAECGDGSDETGCSAPCSNVISSGTFSVVWIAVPESESPSSFSEMLVLVDLKSITVLKNPKISKNRLFLFWDVPAPLRLCSASSFNSRRKRSLIDVQCVMIFLPAYEK